MPYSEKFYDLSKETAVSLRCRKSHPQNNFFLTKKDRLIFIDREDINHAQKELERMNHERKREVIWYEQIASGHLDFVTSSKLRKRNTTVKYLEKYNKSN